MNLLADPHPTIGLSFDMLEVEFFQEKVRRSCTMELDKVSLACQSWVQVLRIYKKYGILPSAKKRSVNRQNYEKDGLLLLPKELKLTMIASLFPDERLDQRIGILERLLRMSWASYERSWPVVHKWWLFPPISSFSIGFSWFPGPETTWVWIGTQSERRCLHWEKGRKPC